MKAQSVIRYAIILSLPFCLCACSPVFVLNGAYQQAKILIRRQPINDILKEPGGEFSEEQLLKLQLVPLVREFCSQIGLDTKQTFTSYSRIDTDELVWVLSAGPLDSFEPYTWWFPIVGSVPYKGYFAEADGRQAAIDLEKEGYETWLRPSAAFSTLGWFNDPLLSSTLKLDAVDLVSTIIHETVHVNVWIPGSVAFNESLANFVGSRAAIDFFRQYQSRLPEQLNGLDQQASKDFQTELLYSQAIGDLWLQLNQLYKSDLNVAEKLTERQKIFEDQKIIFENKNPSKKFFRRLNNAELAQRRLYLRSLPEFDKAFIENGSSWPEFFKKLKILEKTADTLDENRNFERFFSHQLDKDGPAS